MLGCHLSLRVLTRDADNNVSLPFEFADIEFAFVASFPYPRSQTSSPDTHWSALDAESVL